MILALELERDKLITQEDKIKM